MTGDGRNVQNGHWGEPGTSMRREKLPFVLRRIRSRLWVRRKQPNAELTGPAPGGAAAGDAMLERIWASVGAGRCRVRVERVLDLRRVLFAFHLHWAAPRAEPWPGHEGDVVLG